jgi:hypothetical protein
VVRGRWPCRRFMSTTLTLLIDFAPQARLVRTIRPPLLRPPPFQCQYRTHGTLFLLHFPHPDISQTSQAVEMDRILHGNGGIPFLMKAIGEDRCRLSSLGRVYMAVLQVERAHWTRDRTIPVVEALPRQSSQGMGERIHIRG